jgi:hypothetical protein
MTVTSSSLIAAAPDLLFACKLCLSDGTMPDDINDILRAAIQRAEEGIMTEVRCFRRMNSGTNETKERRGIWLMTGPKEGKVFRGDCDEIRPSRYDLLGLIRGGSFMEIEEIQATEAIQELQSWPEGVVEAMKIFAQFPTGSDPEGC